MVTITAIMGDLQQLTGIRLPKDNDELNELLYYVKCELSGPSRTEKITPTTELQIENVDTNRPDTWSTEGIARALRGIKGVEVGLRKYSLRKTGTIDILVDPQLEKIRPYISCVVAKGARQSDDTIRGLIRLQEKLDQSYGRRRKRSSIGFYDFDQIRPPLTYGLADKNEISFVPLDRDESMTLGQILEQHPKGIEYGDIVKAHRKMPILLDAERKVLSFPPIINSNDLGKITPSTKNILVEVTGTAEETVNNTLTILTTALADRGAALHPARIHYNYGRPRTTITPNLTNRRIRVKLGDVNRLTGLNLTSATTVNLLRRARYDALKHSEALTVLIPCYRLDILHPVDVIEDIAISYSLNNLKPKLPTEDTPGGVTNILNFSNRARSLVIGFGFQEVMTFMMTTPEKLYVNMIQHSAEHVEIVNPKMATMTSIRSWLLPNLLEFLSNNRHVEYPQKIFEVGLCTLPDAKAPNRAIDRMKLACVSAHSRANFTEMKSILEALMTNLHLKFELQPTSNPTFLDGRIGSILIRDESIGVIGETHPQVLENWKLENPVAAMELDLEGLFEACS
jgi:phenylalanyl-tRNA synthetase beta chain